MTITFLPKLFVMRNKLAKDEHDIASLEGLEVYDSSFTEWTVCNAEQDRILQNEKNSENHK